MEYEIGIGEKTACCCHVSGGGCAGWWLGLRLEHYLSKDIPQPDVAWEGPVSGESRYVFYPRYLPENCEETLAALDKGELKLDNTSPKGIGLNPEWDLGDNVSGYSYFYLHSLRFIACLIKAGGEGKYCSHVSGRHYLA